MIALSNSSPIILLARVGHLHLLPELFDRVLIPSGVREEILAEGGTRPGAAQLATASWISVQGLARPLGSGALLSQLGRGEAEVISLALEIPAPVTLLLDDAAGRRLALEIGFAVLGSAGVLVRAKEQGLIPLVRPALDDLLAAGLYLSEALYHRLLSGVGEALS